MTSKIIMIVVLIISLLNFSGYFIEDYILRTTALPSKLNTATPKNKGMLAGLKYSI